MENMYLPEASRIIDIKKHTDIDYTFRMEFSGEVRPGQFFEVSIPKYGEAPISVCEIGKDYVDLTIRRVGRVTDIIHSFFKGDRLFMRGPYGNGFDVNLYKHRELVVAAGGTGTASVKGIIDYFAYNRDEVTNLNVIVGFKSPEDILFRDNIEKWSKNANVILTVDRAGEDYHGNVGLVTKYIEDLPVENLKQAQVIVVGPPMMMKFTIEEFLKKGISEENIWVSYERKMCCGLGKCGHCRMNDTYICLEGPVFNYVKAKHMVD